MTSLPPAGRRDDDQEASLRPVRMKDFVGQERLCANLRVFVQAALDRKQPLDHLLFHGPPGLGKTTLARIIAREMGAGLHATPGPVIARAGDLASLLTGLSRGDVLFIDEIHRLPPAVEELLYGAMEDFHLDLMIGEGPSARPVRLDLPPFTLIGATTRTGLMTTPLRERFGVLCRLDFYDAAELGIIIARNARQLGFALSGDGVAEIARRSRGTPRIAGRLLRRVRDFATVAGEKPADRGLADAALAQMEVDSLGLDTMDRRYLELVIGGHGGGPVGIETLAAALSEPRDAIEDIVEPFLLQLALIRRTSRGRVATPAAWRHLGLTPPARALQDMLPLVQAPDTQPGDTGSPQGHAGTGK